MAQILSLPLPDSVMERLDRFALEQGGMTRVNAGQMLLEESLRQAEHSGIEFRDFSVGRQACMKNSSLAVWEVIMIAQNYNMDAERVAAYFQRPIEWVQAAFQYAAAYPEEIERSLEKNRVGYEELKRILPNLRLFEVPREVLEGRDEA